VDEDNWIHSLTAQGEEEHDGKTGPKLTYNDNDLKCKGKGVQSTTKEMAAISFQRSDGVLHSRLYYADAEGTLQGLNLDGSGEWYESDIGRLDDKNGGKGVKIQPNTSITALYSPETETIKVYYYKLGSGDRPWLAWWRQKTDGKQIWKTKTT